MSAFGTSSPIAIPPNAVFQTNSSGNAANAAANASFNAVAGVTNYLLGIAFTGSGSTAGLVVNQSISGLIGGTMTFVFTAPTGVLAGANPLVLTFWPAIPASAVNTQIAAQLPALGAGSTNAAVVMWGYRV